MARTTVKVSFLYPDADSSSPSIGRRLVPTELSGTQVGTHARSQETPTGALEARRQVENNLHLKPRPVNAIRSAAAGRNTIFTRKSQMLLRTRAKQRDRAG
jgi:hypothetical protein